MALMPIARSTPRPRRGGDYDGGDGPRGRGPILAPDYDYLIALRRELEDSFRMQDEQIDRLRELRQMARPSPVAPELRFIDLEIRDPTIADEVQRVVATLVNQPARLSVTPGKPGVESAEANATDREHWTEEVLRIAGSRRDGPPTITRLADALCGDGGGVTKFLWRPDLWDHRYSLRLHGYDDSAGGENEDISGDTPEGKRPKPVSKREARRLEKEGAPALSAKEYTAESEAAKKASGPPFVWSSVDVRTVYPVFAAGRVEEVLEVSERPVSATFRRYRLRYDDQRNIVPQELAEPSGAEAAERAGPGNLQDTRLPGTCLFLEHWDDEWVTHYVLGKAPNKDGGTTGRIVDQWRHGYGRHPYFFTLGFMPSWWSNRKIGWSISETKRWLVEFRAYLWTIFAQQIARDTLTPVSMEVPESGRPIRGSDGTPKAPEKWELGKVYYTDPGVKAVPWQFPQSGESLKDMIALVTDMIERLGTPRVEQNLGGIEASGFAINQVLAEARLRFDPLAQAMERTLEEITRFLWHLVRTRVGETVWVYATSENGGWKGLGPDDLKGDVRIEWKLDPTLPSAALVESRYWVEQVEAGFASMDMAIEAQGRNPDEVRFQQALDRLRKSEWYLEMQDKMVAAAVGRGDLAAKAWAAKQLAETGAMPGQPPPPEGAMPGGLQTTQSPQGVAANGQVPAGMGAQPIPDMAAQAISPNQEGARGQRLSNTPPGTPVVSSQGASAGTVNTLRG